jgi:hypothetical protein
MLRLYAHKRVCPRLASAIRRFLKSVAGVTEIRHWLPVSLVPAPTLQAPDGALGFAVFVVDPKGARILVAGENPFEDCPEREFIESTLHNVAHEIAHYEQWRDGRKVQERGVNLRATNLLRKAGIARL